MLPRRFRVASSRRTPLPFWEHVTALYSLPRWRMLLRGWSYARLEEAVQRQPDLPDDYLIVLKEEHAYKGARRHLR